MPSTPLLGRVELLAKKRNETVTEEIKIGHQRKGRFDLGQEMTKAKESKKPLLSIMASWLLLFFWGAVLYWVSWNALNVIL